MKQDILAARHGQGKALKCALAHDDLFSSGAYHVFSRELEKYPDAAEPWAQSDPTVNSVGNLCDDFFYAVMHLQDQLDESRLSVQKARKILDDSIPALLAGEEITSQDILQYFMLRPRRGLTRKDPF